MKRKRKLTLPTWLHAPAYYVVRSLIAAAVTGDLENDVRAARVLARSYAAMEKKRFRRTMDTLGVAFPEMPEDERRARALEAYEHLFTLVVEMAYTPRLITHDSWANHVSLGNLDAALPSLLSGQPSVLVTSHCGNWELLGFVLALMGFPIYAVYRPLDMPLMDAWVRRTRERRGLMLIDKFEAVRRMPEILRRGGQVGFIADQNAGDRGLFVPFFNRLASTYKSVGLMAMKFDIPVICGTARRLVPGRDNAKADLSRSGAGLTAFSGESFRYCFDVNDVIHPKDWKDQPDPLFYITARYRRALENMVRAAPEQNLWLHRYWKSRPRHEHQGKPLPRSMREKIASLPWITDADLARIEEWSARDTATMAAGQAAG
jgi:KDO2-lipid IV(A) lauroyltransferase